MGHPEVHLEKDSSLKIWGIKESYLKQEKVAAASCNIRNNDSIKGGDSNRDRKKVWHLTISGSDFTKSGERGKK